MSEATGSSFSFLSDVKNDKTKTLVEKVKYIKKLGNAEFSKGNYEVAITYYTAAISMCPETEREGFTREVFSGLYQNRAAAYSKLNNNEDSMVDCNKALDLVPRNQNALSRRARVLSELGNFKLASEDILAVQIFDQFKNKDEMMFGDSVMKKLAEQNYGEYIKHNNAFNLPSSTFIRNYIKSFDDDIFSDEFTMTLIQSDINTGLEYALKCIQDQKYEEIEIACQEEINKTENTLIRRSLALNLVATFYALRGNDADSIEHLTTVIENPNVPNKLIINSLIKRAIMYQEQEKIEKSLEDFKHAEDIDPNSSAVYHHRAFMYLKDLNFEKAVVDFKKAVELNPKFYLSFVRCYYAQFRQSNKKSNKLDAKKFLKKLKKFVITHPYISESYYLYGRALMVDGAYKEADLMFGQAHEMHPDETHFLVNRALNISSDPEYFSGRIRDVFNFLEQAFNIDPNCYFAYEVLGMVYMRIGKFKESLDCYEKAIKIRPKSKKKLLKSIQCRDLLLAQFAVIDRFGIQPTNLLNYYN